MEYKEYFGYKVGKDGSILYPDGNKKNLFKTPKGYLITSFKEDGHWKSRPVHRVVAYLWVDNPQNLSDVDHINGIRDDNRVENLRWMSHSDNIRHSYASGRRVVAGGKNANALRTDDEIRNLCRLFQELAATPPTASRLTKLPLGLCQKVHGRKQWRSVSKDYTWPQRSETRSKDRRREVASKQEAP